MHQAVQLLQVEIVRALLTYPSPQVALELLNKPARAGFTPLRSARRMNCNQLQHKEAQEKIVEMLVAAGAIDLPFEPDDRLDSSGSGSRSDSEGEESMQ